MAISYLPTDFVDAETLQQKYKVTDVGNGEALFEDVSDYPTDGSYFGANEINNQHQAINDLITLAESTDLALTRLMNGTTVLESVTSADVAQSAETAITANTATTAGQFSDDVEINGEVFDGTSNITIVDSSKLSNDSSFILVSKQQLTFTNKVCTLSDSRITANSLANVVFTANCIDNARNAVISVETVNGAVNITAGRTPRGTLTATVYIRVV